MLPGRQTTRAWAKSLACIPRWARGATSSTPRECEEHHRLHSTEMAVYQFSVSDGVLTAECFRCRWSQRITLPAAIISGFEESEVWLFLPPCWVTVFLTSLGLHLLIADIGLTTRTKHDKHRKGSAVQLLARARQCYCPPRLREGQTSKSPPTWCAQGRGLEWSRLAIISNIIKT